MVRYDRYNHTGVQWLGNIPEHWAVKRIKDILKTPLKYGANEAAIDDDKNNPRYIRITDFGENEILKDETFKSIKYEIAKNYLLQAGDILFARSGATVGKSFQFKNYNGLACYAGYLIKATPNTKIIQSDYLSYFTKSISYDEWKKNVFIQATIENISAEKYDRLELMIPSLEEQTAIAQYLDTKTQAIDKKINLLTQKADFYKELRKSIINDAVSKGLDKNVKLKESGIEWIGQIPEHWEVKRVKDVALINRKTLDEKTVPSYQFKYIDIGNVGSTGSLENIEFVEFVSAPSRARRIVKKGDVIVSTVRTYLKAIATINFEANNVVVSTGFAVLTSKPTVEANFIGYFAQSDLFVDRVIKYSSGVSYPAINATILSAIEFLTPPLEEQTAIATYLDEKTQKIDAIVSNIGKQTNILKELRKTLINDVVTGKIMINEKQKITTNNL